MGSLVEGQSPVTPTIVNTGVPTTPPAVLSVSPPFLPLPPPSRPRIARRWYAVLALFLILGGTATVYVADTREPEPAWDGGTWTDASLFPLYGTENYAPDIFAFGGQMHMFLAFVSSQHGTPGGNSSEDYGTADTLHFVRQNGLWTPAAPLSDATDNTTVFVSPPTEFQGQAYVIRWVKVRQVTDPSRKGSDPVNWNTTVELMSFDGSGLHLQAVIGADDLLGGEQRGPWLRVSGNQLLALWRDDTGGEVSARTTYWRSFDANQMSSVQSFQLPTPGGWAIDFLPRPDGLYVPYMGRNVSTENETLFLGKVEGPRVVEVARVAEGLPRNGAGAYVDAAVLGSQLMIAWNAGGQVNARTFDGTALSPPMGVASGWLSHLVVVGSTAYCTLWARKGIVFHSDHDFVAAFDGAKWELPYQVSGPLDELAGYPASGAAGGELWVSWATRAATGWSFTLRTYRPAA